MTSPLLTLEFDEAAAAAEAGVALADLRPADEYLDVHIPGSIALVYESGPGMSSRARDCLPLEVPLVLLDPGNVDCNHAAASLRGKGFRVLGKVDDAINKWAEGHGTPASTEVLGQDDTPQGTVLDVGDPGAAAVEGAVRIPIDHLWGRAGELDGDSPVIVVAGYGVRAAMAVGILERTGVENVLFWRRRAPL
jgi:rhodanese-related sulfurtransferase